MSQSGAQTPQATIYTVLTKDRKLMAVVTFPAPVQPREFDKVINQMNPRVRRFGDRPALGITFPHLRRMEVVNTYDHLLPSALLARVKQMVQAWGYSCKVVAPPRPRSR